MNVALLTSSVWSRSERGVTCAHRVHLWRNSTGCNQRGQSSGPTKPHPPCYPVLHRWPTVIREKSQHSLRYTISVADWQTRGARRRSTRCWSVPMVTRTNRSQLLTEGEDLCGPIKGKHLQILAHNTRSQKKTIHTRTHINQTRRLSVTKNRGGDNQNTTGRCFGFWLLLIKEPQQPHA